MGRHRTADMTQLDMDSKMQTAPMLMAQLKSGMHEANSLAKEAIESEDEADKALAKKKVAQLKSTLKKLKDQVLKEAGQAKKSLNGEQSAKKAQKISNWVKQIAQKVPQITKLEKKLGMLQGLDPVLEGILSDLNRVTDFSNLIKLQKVHKQSVAAQQE